MKKTLVLSLILISSSLYAEITNNSKIPEWSTPNRGSVEYLPKEVNERYTLEGSEVSLSMKEIDDKYNAPEWFPNEENKMPFIVKHGDGKKVWACASCHLSSGMGHPESARLAGLSSEYLQSQMLAFKKKERIDYSGHMNRMAVELSLEEIKEISDWFATLKPHKEYRVVETKLVPKTIIDNTRMRIRIEDSNLKNNKSNVEVIANRIIEIPENIHNVKLRSPKDGFIAYVKPNSIKKGKDKSISCTSCHGSNLKGTKIAPNIAGLSPMYITRQLYGFKNGLRFGKNADKNNMMSSVSKNLTEEDIYNISAYIATLNP